MACVSMLLGRSYADACRFLRPDKRKKKRGLRETLAELGLECGQRLILLRNKRYRDLE